MQGWSPDFIPKLTEDAVALKLVDRVLPIDGAEAMQCSRDLARKEGIIVGITSGGAFAGALRVCHSAPAGANVLCMLPDTGERYLSTPLFADVPVDMTDEELAIAASTPNYRFDSTAPAPTAMAAPADAEAGVLLDAIVRDEPVVMFAFEWCEFCWAVRNMFAAYKIACSVIALDAVEYQQDNRGGRLRAALGAKISATTIPQVFVAGELVGGCTETLQAVKDGRLQALLARAGVSHDPSVRDDPFGFLPAWRQRQ
jgi:cysteine synthase A